MSSCPSLAACDRIQGWSRWGPGALAPRMEASGGPGLGRGPLYRASQLPRVGGHREAEILWKC